MAGYSRLMGADEEGTLAALKRHRRELIAPKIAEHKGRIVKTTGDGLLVEFESLVSAVRCAVEMQRAMAEREAATPDDRRVAFRVGINLGDIIIDGDDIYGDGVNVAARLQELAEPGGICLSHAAHDQVRDKLPFAFEDLGEKTLMNIARPVRAYRVQMVEEAAAGAGPPAALPLPDRPSIAVLPFANMSGDPEQAYFSDGIAEDIITALSRLHWFFVIARNSSFTYRGKAVDVRRVGCELGVRYVLEGSVRKAGQRVRISVQLSESESGNHIWADRYDRELADIFAVQDEITEAAVASIEPTLYVAEAIRAQRKRPGSLDAWDYVMRAAALFPRLTERDMGKALDLLKTAITLDPGFALAHSRLAFTSVWRDYFWGGGLAAAVPDDSDAAKTALSLDPDDPWAHLALGCIAIVSRQVDAASAEIRRALDVNPNFAVARAFHGLALAFAGQGQAAIAEIDRAVRLSPRDPFNVAFSLMYSTAHYVAEDYHEAREWARRAVREIPEVFIGYINLAAACGQLGARDEAREALAAWHRLQPDLSLAARERSNLFVDLDALARYRDGLRKAGLKWAVEQNETGPP